MRILVIFIALCLLAGLSQWSQATTPKPQRSQPHQTEEENSKKSNQPERSQQSTGTTHAASDVKNEDDEQHYDPYSDKMYRAYLWATVIGVVGGLVGIIFLVVQTFATTKAAKAAKTSADAALKSADAAVKSAQATINAERPWMFIEIKTKLIAGLIGNPPESISFSVRFHNYGSTPAEIVGFDQHIECRNSSDDLPKPPEYSLEGHVLAHTRMIAPGKEFEPPGEPSFVPSSFFVAEQWKDIRNSRRRLVYWGRLQYRDLIEDAKTIHEIGAGAIIHETCFCYFWSPALNEFLICGPLGYNKHT